MASNGAYEAPINAGLLSANEFVELMMQRLTENTWYCTSVNNSPAGRRLLDRPSRDTVCCA